MKVCSISNCGSPIVNARGWCLAHYRRWQRHGDPLGGGTREGEPLRYLQEVVFGYRGRDCLTWPYARGGDGYGQIWRDGRMRGVHRLVCTEVHGAPPTAKHESAHICGKGDEACCNPNHLAWKTPAENQADRLAHGTHSRGERSGKSKLTEADVAQIRALQGVAKKQEIAKQFGISRQHTCRILKQEAWAWLTPEDSESKRAQQ